MAVTFTTSAHKHGIDPDDALHAMLNYVYRLTEFDEPRVPGGQRPDLFIGPTRDRSNLLEVLASITPPNGITVFHVMIARRKMIEIAEQGGTDG